MPFPDEILSGLEEITNSWRPLAILWHVYFGALLLALLSAVRPSRRIAGILLALPMLSVSILAWAHANPFNGTLFAVVGLVLLVLSVRMTVGHTHVVRGWALVAGGLMVAFGWIYPHFLDAASPVSYTYAAPTGLIPCPTLSIVIGFSLILGELSSRSWSLVLTAAGIFYGLFGAFRLGVAIDLVLVAGALSTPFGLSGDRGARRQN